MQLVSLLKIPGYLAGIAKDISLHTAFQKYHAYLAALKTYDDMIKEGTWTVKKLTKSDIIELFISKSFYYSYYNPLFSKLTQSANYSKMVDWLDNDSSVEDLEV
jgi:hypothetical protein